METRLTAIIADGSEPFITYFSRLLNRLNFEVLGAVTATEAIEKIRKAHPQLVVMDMAMPGMQGVEILRILREDEEFADLPVIMTSSQLDRAGQWEAFSLGCIEVLEKPIALRQLHKAIQRCELFPGGSRRYLRAVYTQNVGLRCQGKYHEVSAVTLSERGILVRTGERFPQGAHVDLDLPHPSGGVVPVGGSIIYSVRKCNHGPESAREYAIKFDRLTIDNRKRLGILMGELLIGDIIVEQTEPVLRPLEG